MAFKKNCLKIVRPFTKLPKLHPQGIFPWGRISFGGILGGGGQMSPTLEGVI